MVLRFTEILHNVRKIVFQQQQQRGNKPTAKVGNKNIKQLGEQFSIASNINPQQFLKSKRIDPNLIPTIQKGIPTEFFKMFAKFKTYCKF